MATTIFTAYDTTNSERELHRHSGEAVEVLGRVELDHDEFNVYRVRFSDGYQAEAFDDELTVLGL